MLLVTYAAADDAAREIGNILSRVDLALAATGETRLAHVRRRTA